MYRLALELAEKQKRILVTTTTMIFHPEVKNRPYNLFFTGCVNSLLKNISPKVGTITVAGAELIADGKKIKGYSPLDINQIKDNGQFDIILIEADGARGKPIKAPAENEPVIPENTDIIAGIVGMDSLGKIINSNNVHRPEIFTTITNSSMGDKIEAQLIINLLNSPLGLFKETSPKSRKIVIFNKSDTAYRILKAKEIAENISESLDIERILITTMTGNDYESYRRHEVSRNDLGYPPVMAVIRS